MSLAASKVKIVKRNMSEPEIYFAFVYFDTPRRRRTLSTIQSFLDNYWHLVDKYVPEIAKLDKKKVAVMIAPPRRKNPAFASFAKFKPKHEKDFLWIELGDAIKTFPDFDEIGLIFAVGGTLIHELLHNFYEDEATVESKLDKFERALADELKLRRKH